MNKKFQVEYLPSAEQDLTDIFEYVLNDSPLAAIQLIEQIDNSVSKLEDFPYMGSTTNDTRLTYLGYRILIVESYLVFYAVIGDLVEIRRILHSKRKYDFLF
jgi:addiction module RelE/StbE family toxin